MGGYSQQPWDEKVPGVDVMGGAMPRPKRGLLGALLGIGDQSGEWSEETPTRGTSIAGSAAPTVQHRVEDDVNRTPRGGQGPQGNQLPDDGHLAQMQAEYDRLGQPQPRPNLSLKQKIMQSLSAAAPVALGAAFGGTAGATGAAQGEIAAGQRQQQQRNIQQQRTDQERGRLRQEIEAERRIQEQERGANLRAQMQADALKQRDTEFQQAEAGRNQRLRDEMNQRDQFNQQRERDFEQREQQQWNEFQQKQNKQGEVGTWQFGTDNDGNPALFNSKTGQVRPGPAGFHPKSEKPTADEQRRADLATNMNENLDQLEGLVTAHPELFGPPSLSHMSLGGRGTSLKMAIGSNDPNIGTLKTIKEQMGMAMVGAHAMRNAQHVEAAANSILNSFNNGPDAIKASINAARASLQTFQQDAQRAKGAGNRPPLKQQIQSGLDLGPASGKPDGATGKLDDGTPVVVRNGRIMRQ